MNDLDEQLQGEQLTNQDLSAPTEVLKMADKELSQALLSMSMRERLASLRGIWKGRGSTDELMRDTRGED